MKCYKTLAVAIALAVSACAKKPDSIAPAYVSPVAYDQWTCVQLGQEDARLRAAYATAAKQQDNARTGDIVGVVLIGLPVSSMSGDNIAPQIARLKGEQEAVRRQLIRKNCG